MDQDKTGVGHRHQMALTAFESNLGRVKGTVLSFEQVFTYVQMKSAEDNS